MKQLGLLKTRRFMPLFATQFLGAFNDNTFKNALIILITFRLASLTGLNAEILVTLAAGIFILPFFLFSATAGQLADRYEKSRLVSIIKFIEIILMAGAALGFYLQNTTILMTVLFLLGTHATFFGPLKYSILPEHLAEDELVAGNGLIEAGTFLSILMGTILGGVLILDPSGEFIISTLVIAVAVMGWITSLYIPKTRFHKTKISLNIAKETFQLIKYARTHKDIFRCILGISWFWLVGATFLSQFPTFVKDVLHANESIVTLFLAVFSIGLAIGSLLCNKLLKGKVHATYVPLGVLGISIFTFDLYFPAMQMNSLAAEGMTLVQFLQTFAGWRIVIDLLLVAISAGIYTVPLYAILQHRSPKEHCARIIASNNIINALFMVFAALAAVVMLKLDFSVAQIFLAIAITNAFVGIYICKLLPEVFVRNFFRAVFTFLYRVEVRGIENYLSAGERVVIIVNHTSFIDALLLATFLPDKLAFAINTTMSKKWWVRLFLCLVDSYPVDPANPMAIKSLIDFVKEDKRCIIFPEGRLTVTGALMKIYEGPGLIADRSGGKLLPICIQGAQLTPFSRLRGKVRIRMMPKITITIFPSKNLEVPSEITGRKRRQQIGYKLYDAMTEMMFLSSNYQQTLFSSLLDAKSSYGGGFSVLEDIERQPLNYRQLISRCFILGGIIAKTTQEHEAVGVLLPNMVTNAVTFFSLHAFNRVPAMLNYSTGVNNVVVACQTAQIQTVYSSRRFVHMAKLEDMVAALEKAEVRVVYLEDLRNTIKLTDKLKGLFMGLFPRIFYQMLHHEDPESAAVILFTSGSEGTPKGVVLSHKNIQANRLQLAASVDFNVNDKVFNALPIFHSFGLTGGMLLPILSGIKIFFYPSPLHYRIVPELIYDTNATILFGTDTFLSGYARFAHPYDFYSVRYVFAGAEALKNETRIVWSQKFGVRVFEGYGATETSPVLATNTPMQNKPGTVGRLLPGLKCELVAVPGIDQGGVLKVNGPNVMKGYLLANKPGVLVPPQNGWYETGDIVSIDDTGFVTIKGRVKRFAKIAGEMVSLAMVEQKVQQLWPEAQHAVVNVPDAKKGEQLVLVTTQQAATRDEVIRFAKSVQMGEIMIPRKVTVVKEMPLLGSGKINYPGVMELAV